MSAAGRRLTRHTLPRAIVLAGRADMRGRVAGAVRRRGRVELYLAFDDPCSAVALLDLADRVGERDADLALYPVVERGIADDPAVESKRRYAITDARRLAARLDLVLARAQPLPAASVAPLAGWVASGPPGEGLQQFCIEAMRALWFDGAGTPDLDRLAQRFREIGLGEPRDDAERVRANERRMRRRGPYDVPAAWVHGQWFFAHDRGAQIAARLDELGFGGEG